MRSIALFPCSNTDGALIVGELANTLRLKVYTDEMLLADIAERFGVPVKISRKILFGSIHAGKNDSFEQNLFVDLAKRVLVARFTPLSRRHLFYGLHTLFLDPETFRILRVLIFDTVEARIKRAVRQEGFPADVALEFVRQHDKKVSRWTHLLYAKEAYSQELHDVVVQYQDKKLLEVIELIRHHYKDIESWFTYFQEKTAQNKAMKRYLLTRPDHLTLSSMGVVA